MARSLLLLVAAFGTAGCVTKPEFSCDGAPYIRTALEADINRLPSVVADPVELEARLGVARTALAVLNKRCPPT